MWTIEQLEAKVAEMANKVEQSASQHHILLGSKLTFDGLLAEAKKAAEVVAVVDPEAAPVCSTIEQVVDVIESAYV